MKAEYIGYGTPGKLVYFLHEVTLNLKVFSSFQFLSEVKNLSQFN